MTNEPESDLVFVIFASPEFSRDGICFAARQSGLFVSRDSGKNWASAYESLASREKLTTQAVALSPDFIHDRTVLAGVNGGILQSTDAGVHWRVFTFPSPAPMATCLAFSPAYALDGTAFCGTMEDGVLCSTDRGNHWSSWNFGLLDLRILCLAVSPAFAGDETIFAGGDSGISWSRNAGRAWRAVDLPADAAAVTSIAFSPAFSADKTLFAGNEAGDLLFSNDSGRHWTAAARLDGAINQIIPGSDWPSKPELLALVGSSIQYSPDAGRTWAERPFRLPVADDVTCLTAPMGISPAHPVLVGTLREGVFQV